MSRGIASKGPPDEPATVDGCTLRLLPTPGRRKAQLNSLEGVRREMSRVHRGTESGKRDSAEASKLVYILSQIGRVLEVVEIETRLRLLEDKANARLLTSN